MAHLLLWRQILTGGSRGVCIQGLEVKRSQSWEVVNMSFFACSTHRRAHPLQKSSSKTLYTFALCTLYIYVNCTQFDVCKKQEVHISWQPIEIPLPASERHNVKSAVDHFGSFQRHCKMICRGLPDLWRTGLARPHCKLLFPFSWIPFHIYFKLQFLDPC